MQDQISQWVNFLRVTVSAKTADNYAFHLRKLAETAPGRNLEDWTRDDLLKYIADRRVAGNGDAILKQAVGAFKNFFRFHRGKDSPAATLPYPKVHRRQQRTLDNEQALKVIATCDTSTPIGVRDLAIFTLMLDTGLRASEVCRARVPDLDLAKRRLKVIVKGGDEDVAVFSKTTAQNLARWLSFRGQLASSQCDTIFVAFWGNMPGYTLTPEGLRDICEKAGKRAGIGRLSPHDFRRTFATIAIRQGAPTRVVQAAGRWGDVSMVERYTQAIQAEDFERYSPVEALLKGREDD